MHFSKKSEYALRALLELTNRYDCEVVPRAQLSERLKIPAGFLEGILLTLKHAGIVASRRGIDGGFKLLKPPSVITVGQIIRILDGPLAPIACVSQIAYQKCDDCPYSVKVVCPIQNVMLEVRNAIAGILDHYTLEDFARTASSPSLKKERRKGSPLGRQSTH
jgi:Rrf2 family cysteine metabolism transcriptional repressor